MTFNLTVVPHYASWRHEFAEEAARIRVALGSSVNDLLHIGSTAIPGIHAKPIIDILADVTQVDEVDVRAGAMQALGYECLGEFGLVGRRYFRKNDRTGMRTHQVHAYVHGSPDIARHLAFRDYLIAHPAVAQVYSDLKRRLVETCQGDLEAYMDGKDAFIKGIERQALQWSSGQADRTKP